MRRWVASQAESRSGTGAPAPGAAPGVQRVAEGRRPPPPGARRGEGAHGARGEPLTGGGRALRGR